MSTYLPQSRGLKRLRALSWTTRPTVSTETLVLLSSLFFALVCNQLFWHTAMATHPGSLGFAISLMALLVAVHALLLGLLVWRWNAKPLLTLLLFTTALAAHYMDSYNVYLDADMLRNVLHTDHKESRELLTPGLILPLLCYFLIPATLLWRTRLQARSIGRSLAIRAGFLLVVAVGGAAGAML
ncbi:phosphoethanolamine transferase domain-containing protein, partial [Xanthomonas arboricola]